MSGPKFDKADKNALYEDKLKGIQEGGLLQSPVMPMAFLCTLRPNFLSTIRMTITPRSVLARESRTGVLYELKQGQSRLFHKLPSGLAMEVIFQKGLDLRNPDDGREKLANPPLVFIHGSFHAAWCWAEHWLPFFSQNGFNCYALSLLGQVLSLSLPQICLSNFEV